MGVFLVRFQSGPAVKIEVTNVATAQTKAREKLENLGFYPGFKVVSVEKCRS